MTTVLRKNGNKILKKTLAKPCQEIHETWLNLPPIALTCIGAIPKGMLKLGHFEIMYSRPFGGSSKILGYLDPFLEQSVKHIIQLGKVTEHK